MKLQRRNLEKAIDLPVENRNGYQVKSGNIYLVQRVNQKSRHMPVNVQVYKNSFEHYAVVSKNSVCPKCIYLNLRNSFVLNNNTAGTELKIVSNDLEGTSLVLDVVSEFDMPGWVDALQSDSPVSSPKQMRSPLLSSGVRKTSLLQTLTESEEE